MSDSKTKHKINDEDNNKDKTDTATSSSAAAAVVAPMATIGEVFSFVNGTDNNDNTKTRLYLVCGFIFATIAGLALPASLFLFADVLGDVSAVAEEGIEPVKEVAYTMMVLGVISLIAETMVGTYLSYYNTIYLFLST